MANEAYALVTASKCRLVVTHYGDKPICQQRKQLEEEARTARGGTVVNAKRDVSVGV